MTTTPSAGLVVRGLTKRFGSATAVAGLDLDLAPGSFTALLGPSGCGKSTTLAMVAGLLDPSDGQVLLAGSTLSGTPAEKRPVSLVFQKPLLFPNLSVEQNVAFGLRMQRLGRPEIRHRVHEMLERVRLAELAGRRVDQLSGGQEQRVALARALVLEPQVLLLDEPFSQLDAGLRREMRTLVRHLHDESDLITLFVTHDQEEAVEVADEIALLLAGRLVGRGSPEAFYTRPPTLAAARFFGATNELVGQVVAGDFVTAAGRVPLSAPTDPEATVLVIRPEAVLLERRGDGGLDGQVLATRFAGSHLVVDTVLGDGQRLRSHVAVGHRVRAGDRVCLVLPTERCSLFAEGS